MSKPYFDQVDPKVNFPEMEKKLQDKWYKEGIVDKYLHKNDSSNKYFSFLDGPITANNPMGVHHAWGRTYKDLWQKYKNMQGFKQRFQNGFDCQGLWVEVEVEKELGFKNKKDIEKYGVAEFIEKCKERVLKFSGIQTEQTKRLGNFMDWDHSYYTLSDENNYTIWHFLKVCYEKGWIYKGHESVPWCPRCETAISQHEMLTEDYKELVHKSIYLKLPLIKYPDQSLLVWTTTPWTIPANIAVAVDAKMEYALVDKCWVAKDAVERIFGKNVEIESTLLGKELVGLRYKGPFDDLPAVKKISDNEKFHTVIVTDPLIMPITTSEGTGLVHTAVSAGVEDFRLGKKYDLPMIPVISDNADYLPNLGFLAGKNAKKHPEIIFDYLVDREENHKENWIFKTENYKHRYPACWRCKTELVWKVADEWYIAMDLGKPTLREQMKTVAKKIKWLPEFGLERELDWLSNMHDWLISKPNRYWGLALPIYECKKCGNFEVLGSKEELKSRAIEGWDKFEGHSPHKPWIDEVKIRCSKCGEIIERLPDVGNVWLDAGIVPFSTIKENNQGEPLYLTNKNEWKKWFPVDFVTESFPGQFKNWFYSMIAMSTVLENENPFKTVLGYGTLLAEDGRPMHKSWGNAIEFNEGADKIGADVMRWMYARTNPTENMLFGYRNADETRRQFHIKVWNVYNFFVLNANLKGWKPKEKVKSDNDLDRWILARLQKTVNHATILLDEFDPSNAVANIELFVDDLSNWYVRRTRDRIDNDSLSTLYEVLVTLCKITSPVTPYISDLIYTNLTKEESVHLSTWPSKAKFDELLVEKMQMIREFTEVAHALRKELKLPVRQPLQLLTLKKSDNALISDEGLIQLLKDEVNVKNIVWGDENKWDTTITPELKAEGEAREIIRKIQDERKAMGTKLDDKVIVSLPSWPSEHEAEIKKKALVSRLEKGEFRVERTSS